MRKMTHLHVHNNVQYKNIYKKLAIIIIFKIYTCAYVFLLTTDQSYFNAHI